MLSVSMEGKIADQQSGAVKHFSGLVFYVSSILNSLLYLLRILFFTLWWKKGEQNITILFVEWILQQDIIDSFI